MKRTIKGIASDLGLSIATISRVRNNKKGVKPETRQMVLDYLKNVDTRNKLGYSFKAIGIVDTYSRHKIDSYYLSEVIEGADERIHTFDHISTLIHSDTIESELIAYGKSKILSQVSGVLWLEPSFSEKYFKIVEDNNIPCVVINNCEENIPIDFIKSDNYTSAKKAVRFLLEHGHEKIGFIGGYLNLTNHKDRFSGYQETLDEAGIKINPRYIIDDITSWDSNGGIEGMYRILSKNDIPSAVILCSDFLATGAYEAVKARNLKIPDDISIISFDDFPLAAYMNPPLTTFKQPLQEIGRIAANRLFEILSFSGHNRDQPKRILVDCPIRMRESVKLFR